MAIDSSLMAETIEIIERIVQAIGFIVLYLLLGFGPGFVVGMLIANRLFGRGAPTYMDKHEAEKAKALQHNNQWHPDNERWQEP